MKYEEFIGQVRHRARLAGREDAIKAAQATLETLSERLEVREAEHLSAQLPTELATYMQPGHNGMDESYQLDEFFRRVSEREGVPIADANFHARVVIGLLCESVTMGQIQDVRAQLPADFAHLFAVENEGDIPEVE